MSKANILIVANESIIVQDIQKNLENGGYGVAGKADCGEAAIQLAGDLRPDLVLVDIGLKGEMDGVETAKQIQAQFDLPVIYLIAFPDQSTLERACQDIRSKIRAPAIILEILDSAHAQLAACKTTIERIDNRGY